MQHTRPLVLVTALLFIWNFSLGQNLLMNGSFEEFKKLPKTATLKDPKIKHIRPIQGTPDYFHVLSIGKASPTYNYFGSQQPQHGDAFIGITLTSAEPSECNLREYVEFKFTEPLIAGHKYELSFYVSCADLSGYFTDQIGAVFTEESLKKKGISKYIGHPHVTNELNNILNDTSDWIPLTLIFNAKGGEQYMTLGNFHKCNFTTRVPITPNDSAGTMENMKRIYRRDLGLMAGKELEEHESHIVRTIHKNSYYYIDNVQLHASPLNNKIIPFVPSNCKIPAQAQTNLLPDPNFNTSKNRNNSFWRSPSKGTPDFVNGKAGIYLYSNNHKNNREYISATLDTTITNCDSLYIQMNIQATGHHKYVVDKIGAAFTDSNFFQDNRSRIHLPPDFESPSFQLLENNNQWLTICGTFSPQACATEIIIGNFSSDDSTFIMPTNSSADAAPYAHYQIDNVLLMKIGTQKNCVIACIPPTIHKKDSLPSLPAPVNTPDTLFVQFNTNETHVPFLPKNQLLTIMEALSDSPDARVRICGHTDDVGISDYNLSLSKLRAEKVQKQLLNFGIPKEKLVVEYYGESMPLVPNTSKQNRRKNRRVEIIVQ